MKERVVFATPTTDWEAFRDTSPAWKESVQADER
jgi:hypothetical protein